ncbi:MAG: hypothetical protein EBT33_11525 [Betaproteobacteria bacterium]|nr:hypothetical protein [Betaproteobacteria bacterium]
MLVSASQGDPTGRTNGGISYLIYGGVSDIRSMVFDSASGDSVGTSVAETLTGNSGNNQIVAGEGNDTIRGQGGYDVLYGGAGDDRFEITDSNIRALAVASAGFAPAPTRIDGGTGLDTLVVGTGAFMGLANVASRLHAIESIERIELAGGTLQIENGQALTVNEITGPFNRFNTGNGWTVTGTVTGFDGSVDYHQLLIDGSAGSALRLGSDFVKASGSLSYAGGSLGSAGNFDVYANAATRTQLIVRQGLTVQTSIATAPTISSIPEADASRSFGALTLAEAGDTGSGVFTSGAAGTPVLVGLAGTGAVAGQIVRLVWDEQAPVDYTLTSADIAAGQARVTVPSATLTAATATGSIETVPVTAQILSGATAITPLGVSSALVDFTTATAPANAPVINTSNAATSDLAGIAEAKFANGGTSVIDNTLYPSEAVNGTVVQVFLKSAAVVGDWVRINWGSTSFTHKLASAVSVGGSVSVTVPYSIIAEQGYGTFNVTAQQFTADGVAGTAASAAVSVTYRFDLPLSLPGSSSAPTYGFSLFGETTSDKLGGGVSNAGDINGDGYEDLLLGAANVGPSQTGRAYLVFGATSSSSGSIADTLTLGNGFKVTNQSSSHSLGDSVSAAGDLNGDGLADALVGASNADMTSGTDAGAAYTVFGKANTTDIAASAIGAGSGGFLIRGGTTSDNAGYAVSEIGDLNGDGLGDVLVIAQNADPVLGTTTLTNAGRAYIVFGKTGTAVVNLSNLATSDGVVINGFTSNDQLMAGSAAGDVNGDGLPDFILGSSLADPGARADAGRAYVVFGSISRTAINLSAVNGGAGGFVVNGACAGDKLGASVSQAGDVNGDGLADLVIGATGASLPTGVGTGAGRVYVVFGRTAGTAIEASSIAGATGGFVINAESSSASSALGNSVSNAGDVNGDGLADLLIGASLSDTAGADAGNAYVVYGKTSTAAVELSALDVGSSGFRIVGQSAGDYAGSSVSAAGDINGDGFADLVIGALNADQTLTDRGKVYIIYGGMSEATASVYQSANGDAIGTRAADTLTGTSGDNQLVGGDGDDILIGNGGADVLYGGRGNDLLTLNADNLVKLARNSGNDTQAVARIDGGTGIDTLDVTGDGLLFDLTAVSNVAITGIERIDIGSTTTGNELKMSLRDLLSLAGTDNSFNTGTGWAVASSNGATGWGAANLGNQLVVDGSSRDTLTLTSSFRDIGNLTQASNTYRVFQSGSGRTQVIVDADMNVRVAPTLINTSDFEWADGLLKAEAESSGGTVVRVAIKDTGAQAGNSIRINWGSQSIISSALTSTDLTNGYVDVLVPTATLTAETANGSSDTVTVTADLLTAPTSGTLVSASDPALVSVNFIAPNAPLISSSAWSAAGTSDTSGIPEAKLATDWTTGAIPTSGVTDNTLFKSEVVSNGTIVRVQLPTSGVTGATVPAVAGDTVQLSWGSQTVTSAPLTSTDITTNRYIDITVPAATLAAQGYGNTAVTARVVSASTGNASAASGTVTVNFAFDLSLALPGNQTAPSYGFSINGNTNPNNSTGGGAYAGVVSKLGDVNGDGYEDVLIGAPLDALTAYGTNGGAAYVVYGGTRMATVELSAMQSAGTSNGFKINAAGDTTFRTTYFGLAGELDFNGDGLPDYLMHANYGGNARNGRVFLVYGNNTGQNVQLSALDSGANSALGFRVDQQTGVTSGGIAYNVGNGAAGSGGNSGVTDIGDVNGDGLEDIAIGQSVASTGSAQASEPGRVVVLFGTTTPRSNLVLPAFSSLSVAGGFILQGDSRMGPMLGSTVAGEGDVNGDGYTDLLVTTSNTATSPGGAGASPVGTGYVLYGANNLASLNVTEFSGAGFSRGFIVSNIGQSANSQPTVASKMDFVGDVNGDGLDDIVVPGVTEAKVIFGRATGGNVDGDGLDDMIATAYEGPIAGFTSTRIGHIWVVYGQTGNATVNVGNLQPSQGFWVKPFLLDSYITGIDAAGDVNGDGFADLIIGSGEDTVAGRTEKSGKSFIIFGGLSDLQSMTFQSANGDLIGTSAGEPLAGTSGANQMVAGDGNDTVTGNGGADVLYGGRGNDVLVLNADNLAQLARSTGNDGQNIARINGGTGIDTLEFSGSGLDFNLSWVRRSSIEGIEKIDITGSGNNTLRLGLLDVLNYGDNNLWNAGNTNGVSGEALAAIESRRQLRVEGNTGDRVNLSEIADWVRAGNDMVDGNTYGVWNHVSAKAQLLISQNVTVSQDTVAAVTAVADNAGSITGTVASGGVTDDTSLNLSGTLNTALATGETVRIYDGTTYLGNATVASGATTWTYADSRTLSDGQVVSYAARVADAALNQTPASRPYTVTVDTAAPTATVAVNAGAASTVNSGASTTLLITLSEKATDFALADLTVAGGTVSSLTPVASSGDSIGGYSSYTATFTANGNLGDARTVSVSANKFTDAAGNNNTASNTLTLTGAVNSFQYNMDSSLPSLTQAWGRDTSGNSVGNKAYIANGPSSSDAGDNELILADNTSGQRGVILQGTTPASGQMVTALDVTFQHYFSGVSANQSNFAFGADNTSVPVNALYAMARGLSIMFESVGNIFIGWNLTASSYVWKAQATGLNLTGAHDIRIKVSTAGLTEVLVDGTTRASWSNTAWATENQTGWSYQLSGYKQSTAASGQTWVDDLNIQDTRAASPIVLDLNGDGVQTIEASRGVMFDFGSEGVRVKAGWVSPGDGLLVRDLNHDGVINNGSELLGNATRMPDGRPAVDGWDALGALDANGDGIVDAQDAAFTHLRVWVDSNGDGVTDTGELQTLAQHGIAGLHLAHDGSRSDNLGNTLFGQGHYVRSDGSAAAMSDAWFQVLPDQLPQLGTSAVASDAGAEHADAPAERSITGNPTQLGLEDVLCVGDDHLHDDTAADVNPYGLVNESGLSVPVLIDTRVLVA